MISLINEKQMTHMQIMSVKSNHPCQSVIQTIYDIVKAHGGELKVETKHREGLPGEQAGSEFIISLPLNQ